MNNTMLGYRLPLFSIDGPYELPRILHGCRVTAACHRLEDVPHRDLGFDKPFEGLGVVIELYDSIASSRHSADHAKLHKVSEASGIVILQPIMFWLWWHPCLDPRTDSLSGVECEIYATVLHTNSLEIGKHVIVERLKVSRVVVLVKGVLDNALAGVDEERARSEALVPGTDWHKFAEIRWCSRTKQINLGLVYFDPKITAASLLINCVPIVDIGEVVHKAGVPGGD